MKRKFLQAFPSALAAVAIALTFSACKTEEKEPDCVPDPNAAPKKIEKKVERFGLGKVGQDKLKENEWCRACVMSRSNFASCQRVYAEQPGKIDDKGPLKKRALDKACADAGYPKDECPQSAVISVLCKGDPPPTGTKAPGAAVQDLFKALNPNPPDMASSGKGGDKAGEADKTDKAGESAPKVIIE